jgi:hypothetical protein
MAAGLVEMLRGCPPWAAAYVVNGGASEDGFDYFLGWLMAQGRARWEATLADPDSLADVVDVDGGDLDGEEMLCVAQAAAEDEEVFWAALPGRGEHLPVGPAGEHFDFQDQERMRRLTATFNRQDDL